MTEYMTNDYYDGTRTLRAAIDRDYTADNPRHREINVCTIETWDGIEGSPNFGAATELMRKMTWTFTAAGNELGVNHGKSWSYTKRDPRLARLIARTLVAFGGALYARPLHRDVGGKLHLAYEEDDTTCGVAYVQQEEALRPHGVWLTEVMQELTEWNQWARGDVWTITLQECEECPCAGAHPGCDGAEWLTIDGEEGIYDKETARSVASELLAYEYGRVDAGI